MVLDWTILQDSKIGEPPAGREPKAEGQGWPESIKSVSDAGRGQKDPRDVTLYCNGTPRASRAAPSSSTA